MFLSAVANMLNTITFTNYALDHQDKKVVTSFLLILFVLAILSAFRALLILSKGE